MLHADDYGTIRVAGTRVTLETLIAAFGRGDTVDEINEGFPTLALADIHAVIAYYLDNRAEVDSYLEEQEQKAAAIRQKLETDFPEIVARQAKLRAKIQAKRERSE